MHLMDLRVILKELQQQGFEIEFDEDNVGRLYVEVYSGHRLITVFNTDKTDWRSRMQALADCRAAGFRWPD